MLSNHLTSDAKESYHRDREESFRALVCIERQRLAV
jgi:hypothetical protein